MWDGLLLLLLLSSVMGGASFLAGIVPLSFSLSPRQLRLITALGTGILVGTSLIVIIPEGVETLYNATAASASSHGHEMRDVDKTAKRAAFDTEAFVQAAVHNTWRRDAAGGGTEGHVAFRTGPDDGFQAAKEASDSLHPSTDPAHEPGQLTQVPPSGFHAGEGAAVHTGEGNEREPHVWIGTSLILGFILMYAIDALPQHSKSTQPQSFQISLDRFSFNRRSASDGDPQQPADLPAAEDTLTPGHFRPSSTTIGLVIHAAADGIALGASSTAPSSNLSFVIFIALMIHKAPAAFGLTSVLLKQGLSKRMARTHLVIFSLAAPFGALVTFLVVHLLGYASTVSESDSTEFFTGTLLLFSGGTFLYVAMHTMQENGSAAHSHANSNSMNGYASVSIDNPYSGNAGAASKPPESSMTDILVTICGMLLPIVTQFGHAH